jgi:opacity protein-like surface antigen
MIYAAFNSALAPSGGRRMRVRAAAIGIAMAAAINGANNGALAGELDDSFLRGSFATQGIKGYGRWSGFYVGGILGAGATNANFDNGIASQTANILRQTRLENEASVSGWKVLPSASANGKTWGGFAGYNYQTDRLVFGAELTYNRSVSSITATATDSISRRVQTSDGITHDVSVVGSGSIALNEYGTLRARAGYAAGQFLPYAAFGVAVASVSYSKITTIFDNGFLVALPMIENKNRAAAYGGVVALGVDVTLLPNLFLRGEWEYIAFAPVSGIRMNVNTVRAGLGFKF